MRHAFGTVLLCVLAVSAGCAAIVGDDDAEPPGIEDGELVDGERLFSAHAAAVIDDGVEWESNTTATDRFDGEFTEVRLQQRVTVDSGGEPYFTQELRSGFTSSRLLGWGTVDERFLLAESPGTDPQVDEREPLDDSTLAGQSPLSGPLSAPHEVMETETQDDRTILTLSSTGQPENSAALLPGDAESIETYGSTIVVDDDGRIHDLEVELTYTLDGETFTLTRSYEIRSLGDQTIDRPEWAESSDDG
ncbi:MAG: hypothetical protein PPP58_06510 [Natronomonas sp.]